MSRTELAGALASMSGSAIGHNDYVGYFVNQHGEQLVFVQRPREVQVVLLHSDLDWQPEHISPDALRIGVESASEPSAFARVLVSSAV
jgi:hypothetical protein